MANTDDKRAQEYIAHQHKISTLRTEKSALQEEHQKSEADLGKVDPMKDQDRFNQAVQDHKRLGGQLEAKGNELTTAENNFKSWEQDNPKLGQEQKADPHHATAVANKPDEARPYAPQSQMSEATKDHLQNVNDGTGNNYQNQGEQSKPLDGHTQEQAKNSLSDRYPATQSKENDTVGGGNSDGIGSLSDRYPSNQSKGQEPAPQQEQDQER